MSEKALGAPPMPGVMPLTQPRLATRRIRLGPTLLTGLVLLGLVVFVAIAAPLLTPYDPLEQRFTEAFLPPFSAGHILGTDNFGRDIWSRIAYSTRLDLQIGLLSVMVAGLLIGLFVYFRRRKARIAAAQAVTTPPLINGSILPVDPAAPRRPVTVPSSTP